ncbi:GGDEF domain-containing protein [Vibrio salinus]|uniref:GGDEF domain-containing protein n=1 Tax=Vibrio salinus TaxID=2899784 RepID=UPI001E429808|nr:GGDEF domain-containing protein [Vibrio salinus]MCE0494897.1 GGDEF domain-containing protein [Vibrio salinus]
MAFFNFKRASIKQKISGLFIVLLTFLFCVIIFSIYKLKILEQDLKEVAYLDIPLNQIVTQIEFIEMEQHLQLEEYRLEQDKTAQDLKPHQELVLQKRKLKKLLDRAVGLLDTSLNKKTIILDESDHEHVLNQLEKYHSESEAYEKHLNYIYSKDSVSEDELNKVERFSFRLEKEEKSLLSLLNNLSTKDSYYTEKHEEDFFIINSFLGICALILGFFLTVYIIRLIMNRVNNIQDKIKSFDASLNETATVKSPASQQLKTKDELEELEYDIQALMSKLTKEIQTREQVEKQLLKLATRDKLTDLFNRHKWEEEINAHIKRAQRGYPFGLIFLDVDHFKKINDRYGHPTGDQLLIRLAKELTERLRDIDLIFRMGGEEFAIICPMKDTSHTQKIADEIRSHIERLKVDGLPGFTVSLGVSTYREDDTAATLFKRADIALYKAKKKGRNQVICEKNDL